MALQEYVGSARMPKVIYLCDFESPQVLRREAEGRRLKVGGLEQATALGHRRWPCRTFLENSVMHSEHYWVAVQELTCQCQQATRVALCPRWFLIALREPARRKQNDVGCSALLTYTPGRPGLAEKDAQGAGSGCRERVQGAGAGSGCRVQGAGAGRRVEGAGCTVEVHSGGCRVEVQGGGAGCRVRGVIWI